MDVYLDAVRAFHEKNQVSPTQPLPTKKLQPMLDHAGTLADVAEQLMSQLDPADMRWLRAHLLVEECGEAVEALALGDEVKLLDALADLLYVLIGAAVTFDLPLTEAFAEAHTSNMTKERQPDDPHGERVRIKGPNYVAPNFTKVLERHREHRIVRQRPTLLAELEKRWRVAYSDPLYEGLLAQDKNRVDQLIQRLHAGHSVEITYHDTE